MKLETPKRLFARYYDRLMARYEQAFVAEKRALLGSLSGTVVEIGPGTGANLPYLSPGVRWIGVEPNLHMHPLLRAKAGELGIEVELRDLDAGRLPLADGEADGALSTLVLCTVPDPVAALAELRRVLRPGGTFLFWEHVLAPRSRALRLLQHVMTPAQRAFADGCRANRDLAASIRAAGFRDVEIEEFDPPREAGLPPWIRPHIRGRAVR